MRRRYLRHVLVCTFSCYLIASLAACTTTGMRTIGFDKQETRVLLLNEANRDDGIRKNRPLLLDTVANKPNEDSLLIKCAAEPSIESAPIQAVLGLLFGSFVNVTLEMIDQKLQEEIKQYAQAYSGTKGAPFYRKANSTSPEAVATDFNCIRFVRAHSANKGDDKEVTYVDFVMQMRIVNQSWIELRPLRLYFSNPVAKSSNGHYTVAIKLKATSVRRDGSAGARTDAFDNLVLTQKVDLSKVTEKVEYYLSNDDKVVRVPLPPYSVPVQDKATRDFTTFEVSVAETGVPSAGLVMFAKVFAGSREEIAKVLAAAANEHLGWAEDE